MILIQVALTLAVGTIILVGYGITLVISGIAVVHRYHSKGHQPLMADEATIIGCFVGYFMGWFAALVAAALYYLLLRP